VHLLCDGVPLYTGRVGASRDEIVDDVHTVSYETADTRALLGRRAWHGNKTWVHGEQADILRDLVAHTQSQPGGDLSIVTTGLPVTGAIVPGRIIEPRVVILDEIQALANAGPGTPAGTPGFEWDVAPGWVNRQLQLWYPRRGANRGVVLDYTYVADRPRSSIVSNISRQLDPATYANATHTTGGSYSYMVQMTVTDEETGDPTTQLVEVTVPTVPESRAAADIASRPEGLWESTLSYPDIQRQPELAARADRDLVEMQTLVPSYAVTLRRNAWDGPDHVWLGDTVRLIVRSGRVDEDVSVRVQEVALSLGPDGEEDVTLTLGTPTGSLLADLRRMERRVALPERR
jgi:hypothetical protein